MNNNNIEVAAAVENNNTKSIEVTEWAYITGWMKSEVATDFIAQAITEGSYKKGQIKKGSPRFANGKDKTEGYEVRVVAVSGIHPELEQAVVGYRKEIEKKVRPSAAPLKPWKSLLNVDNIAVNTSVNANITRVMERTTTNNGYEGDIMARITGLEGGLCATASVTWESGTHSDA